MKFLVPNYSCLQNAWLGGYCPQIPVLAVLCAQLNLLNPPPNKIPGYANVMGGCCENDNEDLEIMEYTELFDWLSEMQTSVQGRLCSMESVHCEEQHDAVWL